MPQHQGVVTRDAGYSTQRSLTGKQDVATPCRYAHPPAMEFTGNTPRIIQMEDPVRNQKRGRNWDPGGDKVSPQLLRRLSTVIDKNF
ncbi:hypothetical protein GCM10027579_23680 [Calidifontibacter terrae]